MDNNTNKEKWINDVLGSTGGVHRAAPDELLFQRVMSAVAGSSAKETPFPVRQWAAAAVILLALNIGSVLYFANHEKNGTSASKNPFAVAIQSESTYNY